MDGDEEKESGMNPEGVGMRPTGSPVIPADNRWKSGQKILS